MNFKTLTEIIKNRITEDEKGIVYIKKGKEKKVTYRQLLINSLKILGYLQSKGIGYRDELVIQLRDKEDFLNVFWAGILGGIVVIPLSEGNNEEHKLKFFKVWEKLSNPYLICDAEQYDILSEYAGNNGIDTTETKRRLIDIRNIDEYEIEGNVYNCKEEDIAFIQFSSGSTGDPKGVILKHSNLIANLDGIITNANISKADSLLTWMPLTHDMGLIGCHLLPITHNFDQVQIGTADFIRRPSIWLETASKHKCTILQSPNFGYRYTLTYMKRTKTNEYDLSNVRLIFNGAEPISANLCEEFLNEMKDYNLKSSTMYPVYGLAEACLAVTFPNPLEEKITTVIIDRRKMNIGDEVKYLQNEDFNYSATFVDVGYPIKHINLRITNSNGEVLKENFIGFIEIKGINVTSGYYNMEDRTKEIINEEGWLNTGDLGFMKNGRLIVIGRYKDVLFLNGQNYYAHDIERIIMEVAGVKLTELDVVIGSAVDYKKQIEEVVAFVVYKKDLANFLEVEANIKREVNLKIGVQISYVIPIKKVPKTTSGKVQRFNLIQKFNEGEFNSVIKELDELRDKKSIKIVEELDEIERNILSICKEFLRDTDLSIDDNFFEVGINSLTLNQIAISLQEIYGSKINVVDFFSNTSIRKLAKHIKYGDGLNAKSIVNFSNDSQENKIEEIAIVGMSLRAANIDNLEEFWDCIINNKENVKDFPENRKNDLSIFLQKEGYSLENIKYHRGSYLDEIDKFDYKFFKILPMEATAMSPAQRLFLETAVSATEDAGYKDLKGTKTGVFVGYIGDLDGYKYQKILKSSQDRTTPTGCLSTNIAGRVSYLLDLRGPNLMIDTACSSSLVALDLACNEIRNGSCDQAIVGGVSIKTIPLDDGFRAGFESSDYRTRPFDALSNGTGEGEGVVAIMIKPLSAAINDKDNIYAVIKGSAVNHDGESIGLSAPNPVAQTEVILRAINRAKVDVNTISYLEAHGTGTPLGDPIEVQGLTEAYKNFTNQKQYCSIGSVKGNIGHLYEASGLASVVKCCLMMKYKKIPALVNFKKENEKINFSQTPFYITKEVTDWVPMAGIRRCGISNFGFSGTNSHLVLEEFNYDNKLELFDKNYGFKIFTITAKNKKSLLGLIKKYVTFIENNKNVDFSDMCYTSNVGREHYEVRLAVVTNSKEDLLDKLKIIDKGFKTSLKNKIFYGVHKKIKERFNTTKLIRELREEDIELLNDKCNKLMEEIATLNREEYLIRIAQLYTRGANANWALLYDKNAKKIHIPTYEYEKLRCWPSFDSSQKH